MAEHACPVSADRIVLANEIRFPINRPVELVLSTSDVIHSFWVPGLQGKTDMIPGLVNRMVIEAVAEVLPLLYLHGRRDGAIGAAYAERARGGAAMIITEAMVIDGAQVLPNPNGSAPGLFIEHDGTAISLLPGPPREMRPMFENHVQPKLAARAAAMSLLPATIVGCASAVQGARPVQGRDGRHHPNDGLLHAELMRTLEVEERGGKSRPSASGQVTTSAVMPIRFDSGFP